MKSSWLKHLYLSQVRGLGRLFDFTSFSILPFKYLAAFFHLRCFCLDTCDCHTSCTSKVKVLTILFTQIMASWPPLYRPQKNVQMKCQYLKTAISKGNQYSLYIRTLFNYLSMLVLSAVAIQLITSATSKIELKNYIIIKPIKCHRWLKKKHIGLNHHQRANANVCYYLFWDVYNKGWKCDAIVQTNYQ